MAEELQGGAHDAAASSSGSWGYYRFQYPQQPQPLATVRREYADAAGCPHTNFLKGVKWSPDGACLLTASDDGWLRVYDTPPEATQPPSPAAEAARASSAAAAGAAAPDPTDPLAPDGLAPALRTHPGETVYDFAWYSRMHALDPVSCCFASTSRAHPVQLWDACSGQLRCSYRAYDAADEPVAALSLAFSPDGSHLVAGYPKALRRFQVARPGRDCDTVVTQAKGADGSIPGASRLSVLILGASPPRAADILGIISALAFSSGAGPNLLAAGSYSGTVGLFDAANLQPLFLLRGHKGGVTQVMFSPDGNFLYSGARRDASLHCWDVRCSGESLYSITRDAAATNQRLGFDIEPCGQHLLSGGCDGAVQAFDLKDGSMVGCFAVADDVVNGCSVNPVLPLLATASGERRYPLEPQDSEEEGEGDGAGAKSPRNSLRGMCNALRLWRLDADILAQAPAGQHGGLVMELHCLRQETHDLKRMDDAEIDRLWEVILEKEAQLVQQRRDQQRALRERDAQLAEERSSLEQARTLLAGTLAAQQALPHGARGGMGVVLRRTAAVLSAVTAAAQALKVPTSTLAQLKELADQVSAGSNHQEAGASRSQAGGERPPQKRDGGGGGGGVEPAVAAGARPARAGEDGSGDGGGAGAAPATAPAARAFEEHAEAWRARGRAARWDDGEELLTSDQLRDGAASGRARRRGSREPESEPRDDDDDHRQRQRHQSEAAADAAEGEQHRAAQRSPRAASDPATLLLAAITTRKRSRKGRAACPDERCERGRYTREALLRLRASPASQGQLPVVLPLLARSWPGECDWALWPYLWDQTQACMGTS